MIVHTLKKDWCPGEMKANCHVIEFDNFLIVVDPCVRLSRVMGIAKKRIKAVLITHGHYDHIMNVMQYDDLGVPIYANANIEELLNDPKKNVSSMVNDPTRYVIKHLHKMYEDDIIMVEGNAIYAYYTPGHSIDSTCYRIGNNLFTGDTLFSVAVGRTDLPTGSTEDLIDSLDKFSGLWYDAVYAGHGRVSNQDEQMANIYKWKNILKEKLNSNKKENI